MIADVKVTGMSCTSCVRSLETGLLKNKGIKNVRIALLAEKAEIVFDINEISGDQIVDAVVKLGYIGKIMSVRVVGDGAANKVLMLS
jgi:Cu+-exporting ATPase